MHRFSVVFARDRGPEKGWIGAILLCLLLAAPPAFAQGMELRIMRPLDLPELPLVIMQRERLIERTADAMGMAGIHVTWSTPAKNGPLAALGGGDSDLVAAEIVPFLTAAEAGAGSPQQLRGVGALAQRPYVLVTRNAAIKTLRDFGAKDRIAVPALKNSGPAVMLEMAASQEWGPEHFDKLDPLAVARSDDDATDALLSGKGDIDAHFSRSPFADDELGDAAVHRVMDSFDIAGPHSTALLVTTSRFHDANPELCKAILSALQQADDLIRKNPGHAAEMYLAVATDQDIALEDLSDMIGDPDLAYNAAPRGIMRIAGFMRQIGRLKRAPAKWQDLFLPESRDLKGN